MVSPEIRNKFGGLLYVIGSVQFILFTMIAEFEYPNYSVSHNYISDLGVGSTAYMFNTSIIVLGILLIVGALLSRKFSVPVSIIIILAGVGAALVGVFPENTGSIHSYSALLVFLMGGIAPFAIFGRKRSAMTLIYVILGIVSLVALILFATGHYFSFGPGGMERLIAYPELLLVLSYGSLLWSGFFNER
jgi:hypothetical membrane protein